MKTLAQGMLFMGGFVLMCAEKNGGPTYINVIGLVMFFIAMLWIKD